MKTILLLVAAVAFFGAAEAIKCYQCEASEKNCADFDAKAKGVNETTCSGNAVCAKIVYTFSDKKTAVERYCGRKGTANDILGKTTAKDILGNSGRASDAMLTEGHMYNCDTDLCNGVSATGAGLATLTVLSVPLIFAMWQ